MIFRLSPLKQDIAPPNPRNWIKWCFFNIVMSGYNLLCHFNMTIIMKPDCFFLC